MAIEPIKRHPSLNAYFHDMDYVDVKSIDGGCSLRRFIARMLSHYPWWIVWLYGIRERLVGLLGLVKHEKPETLPHLEPADVSFEPGGRVTFFVVNQAQEDAYWVAKTPEDRHLEAHLGVVIEKLDSHRSRFHVFTTVKYIHWTGPVYFNMIRPFHHLVVSQMMKAGIKDERVGAASR
jgi:hypothetical protein